MIKIIRGGYLIDGTGLKPQDDAVVVIENGKIKAAGSAKDVTLPKEHAHVLEINASDKTIMPGLVDGHVHLALGSLNDPIWNEIKKVPELIFSYAAGNAQKALAKGITTMQDCGGIDLTTLWLREAIRKKFLVGPKLVVAGAPITTTSGHLYFVGIRADNADELRKSIRWLVENGVDFIKIMATGGSMTPISNRRRAQYSISELTIAVEEAHRLKKRVVAHLNGTEGIKNAVKAGVDVLVHCNWLGEDEGIEYDESIARLAASKGLYLDVGPIAGVTKPQVNYARKGSELKESSRWDLALLMKSQGVKVYLSSDGIGNDASRFVTDLKSFVESGNIEPLEAITMATKIPAEAMGLANKIGTIEPGKDADIIIVDGNPVEDIAALERVDMVLLNGEIVAVKGRIHVNAPMRK